MIQSSPSHPSTQYQQNQQEEGKIIDLKFEIFRYLRYWYWFALGIFIALFVAYTYLRYTPNVYGTNAKIKIIDNSAGGFKMPSMGGVSLFSRSRVNLENEIEIIKSYRLNEQVVRNLGLQTSFTTLGYISEVKLWRNQPFDLEWLLPKDSLDHESIVFEVLMEADGFRIFREEQDIKSKTIYPYNQRVTLDGIPFKITPKPGFNGSELKVRVNLLTVQQATKGLIANVNISNIGKESEILDLTYNGQNTKKNEDILNELLRVFDLDGVKDRQKVSERTIDFVNERFISLTRELDSIESGKAGYKSQNSVSFLEADAVSAASRKETSYSQLIEMELQVELSKMLNDLLTTSEYSLLPGDIGLTSPAVNGLIQEYNTNILEKERLKISAGVKHPMTINMMKILSDLKNNLRISILNYQTQLKTSLKQLERLNQTSLGLYSKIPEKEKMIRGIERQQEIKETLYMILLSKREEAAVNLAITEPSIKIVDFAITNNIPIAPKRNIIWLGSLMVGLLIPFGLLFLFFASNTKVHSRKDLTDVNPQIPIIAEIPHLENQEMVMEANDRSVLGEVFRILRTNITYLLPVTSSKDAKVIFVTSTTKGEGKTFTSTNTAIAFSALNKKVLMIGADIRNPQLHKLFHVEKSIKGLTNFLYDASIDWRENRVKGAMNNPYLDIIYSGPIPPNPAELLSNGRLEILLNEAKKEYDYIIVDTAPTILVTDTLLISQLADLTIYMTRANYTEKKILAFSGELHEQKKLINIAYVINDVGAGEAYGYGYGYGYGYKYSYNYGYGYGYSEDNEGSKKSKPFWKRLFSKA